MGQDTASRAPPDRGGGASKDHPDVQPWRRPGQRMEPAEGSPAPRAQPSRDRDIFCKQGTPQLQTACRCRARPLGQAWGLGMAATEAWG